MVSRQGMDVTQKCRVPRTRLSNAWVRNKIIRRTRIGPQTHQAPFPPQDLCTCCSLCIQCVLSAQQCSYSNPWPSGGPPQPPPSLQPQDRLVPFVTHTQETPFLSSDCFSWSVTMSSFMWLFELCPPLPARLTWPLLDGEDLVSCLAQNLACSGFWKAQ